MSRSDRSDSARRSAQRRVTLTERRLALAERIANPPQRIRHHFSACELCGMPSDGTNYHMPGCYHGSMVGRYESRVAVFSGLS